MFHDSSNKPNRRAPSRFSGNPLFEKNTQKSKHDRFIPSGIQKCLYDTIEVMDEEKSSTHPNDPSKTPNELSQLLKSTMLEDSTSFPQGFLTNFKENIPKKMLNFNGKSRSKPKYHLSHPANKKTAKPTYKRNVRTKPHKILDAPSLQDDFYFDIINWASTNYISIGLLNHVYCLNVTTNQSFKMASYFGEALVSSIKANGAGSQLAIGTTTG